MRWLLRSRPSAPIAWIVAAVTTSALIFAVPLRAQAPSPAWPFPSRAPGNAAGPSRPPPPARSTPPPYDVPLRQERWEQLADHATSPAGEKALALRPDQWRHGETENFIIHYRSLSDALQIAREIEFDLWYVAQSLGATPEQYARKSHVYVFQDEKEWQKFLVETQTPGWVHSFALRDGLFLDVRVQGGFDSHTLAHETTHAILARIYGNRRWPLWLSEGFAEYMGDASVAARHWRSPLSNQRKLHFAEMTVAELTATARYPTEPAEVARLYETSAKFVRYLFNKYPKELFPKFVDRVLDRETAAAALLEIYGKEFSDMAEFEKRFSRFVR
jgi:hypothetical protein